MSAPELEAGKSAWRAWARSRRQADDLERVSAHIVDGLLRWLPEAPPGQVLLYLAMPGELDVRAVADRTHRPCAVTRTPSSGPLTVHSLASPMARHRFGYEQPVEGSPEIERSEIGVVLVPGLVFAGDGGRLGHGMGYYDTLLSTLPSAAARVGIVQASMLVDALPMEAHDVSMSHLATEHGVQAVS